MIGTGHLPKFADEAYHVERDDLWTIPTAEVPLTSMAADEILDHDELPMRFTAYTSCFRREAGAAGRDTRGLLRRHEFDKVELMGYADGDEQAIALQEEVLARSEAILQDFGLTYRVLDLCAGDLGGSAARTWDIEAYAPGVGEWLEVSSVSWFTDYQARRANVRLKRAGEKGTEICHTVNGSAMGWPRTVAAVLETHRQPDGSSPSPRCSGRASAAPPTSPPRLTPPRDSRFRDASHAGGVVPRGPERVGAAGPTIAPWARCGRRRPNGPPAPAWPAFMPASGSTTTRRCTGCRSRIRTLLARGVGRVRHRRRSRGDVVLERGATDARARFFPDARLSIVEHVLRHTGDGAGDHRRSRDAARRPSRGTSWPPRWGPWPPRWPTDGVGEGDRVAAWLPNGIEAVVAMLGAAALGAVFSSTSPDFGAAGVLDRFGQIEPVGAVRGRRLRLRRYALRPARR